MTNTSIVVTNTSGKPNHVKIAKFPLDEEFRVYV